MEIRLRNVTAIDVIRTDDQLGIRGNSPCPAIRNYLAPQAQIPSSQNLQYGISASFHFELSDLMQKLTQFSKLSKKTNISHQCPLCPRKRTLDRSRGMSAKCQERTLAALTESEM
jgi:hypothetical protein